MISSQVAVTQIFLDIIHDHCKQDTMFPCVQTEKQLRISRTNLVFNVTVVCLTLRSERGDAGDGRRRGNACFSFIMLSSLCFITGL